jgi:hypothetical protein
MAARPSPRRSAESKTTPAGAALDWSGRNGAPLATVGKLAPCVHCGQPALLRHPATGKPCHKVCEEQALAAKAATITRDAA